MNEASSADGNASRNVLPEPDLQAMRDLLAGCRRLREEIARVVIGQDEVIDQLLIALLSRGHCLLVGVPGLAKTLLVSTLARALQLSFRRIQFTPDLMPADITGTDVLQEDPATGRRAFHFQPGPVFTQVLLADEINRTPPKTQAALLEAMQEQQVTTGLQTCKLPDPFFVLATQNPIEHAGTYPLPEAQLDRFMFQTVVSYPGAEDELRILKETSIRNEPDVQPVLTSAEILALQELTRTVPVADHVCAYARDLVRATRPAEAEACPEVRRYLTWGAGPRAGQFLVQGARARAVLDGRCHVSAADVRSVALPVLRHRLVTSFQAESEGIAPDQVIEILLRSVPDGVTQLSQRIRGQIHESIA
jgi:MoxR-like ATPase